MYSGDDEMTKNLRALLDFFARYPGLQRMVGGRVASFCLFDRFRYKPPLSIVPLPGRIPPPTHTHTHTHTHTSPHPTMWRPKGVGKLGQQPTSSRGIFPPVTQPHLVMCPPTPHPHATM